MARLIAPNGSTVNVSDERAERLLEQGYTAADKPESEKAPSKRTSAKK